MEKSQNGHFLFARESHLASFKIGFELRARDKTEAGKARERNMKTKLNKFVGPKSPVSGLIVPHTLMDVK